MEKLDETERKRRFTIKAFIVKAALIAKKRLLEMVNKIIEKRKISLEKTDGNEKPPVDVIDALIHELGESEETQQHRLPFDFIGGNIIEMMIPGEETVPTAMTLPVKFLTDNPVALAHLVVISENLRLANIINALWRKALKDVKVKEGYCWTRTAERQSFEIENKRFEGCNEARRRILRFAVCIELEF
ncbi:3-epi-6-deoxocathasterone 23-monooxygenase CYP90C1-like isoform X3 [Henckelia pumila]|uniref:3-epi-6-deoxocathasterone 23-monooxygenase CYP90C1-like isoform X3 n=1 Tax=Henckelia pumila TaxID=405737 RepID=UPI003C6E8B77